MSIPRDPLPSTWKKFRSGMCDGCWSHCCRLPLEVSPHDLVKMGLATEEECAESLKRVFQKLRRQKLVESFRAKAQIFVIARKANGDCHYLDSKTRQCTIYETRPRVCRDFPLKIGVRPGFCPAVPRKT